MPSLPRQRLKDLAGLSRRKGRAQHGLFLLEGVRAVEAALAAGAPLEEVLVTAPAAADARVKATLARAAAPVTVVSEKDLGRIADAQHGQGVAALARAVVREDPAALDTARTALVLDGVQDPGNVGTLVRTAAWFGLGAVLCGPGTADPESPKAARSAAGALWDLVLVRLSDEAAYGEALDALRARGPLWGADLDGEPAGAWTPPRAGALVLGSEGHGLSRTALGRLDGRVRIVALRPAAGRGVESLNVAVAAGILLHRWQGG